MPLKIQEKRNIIKKFTKISNLATSAVIADITYITANEMTKIRKLSNKKKVFIKVVKNTLLSKIIKNTQFSCLQKILSGPTIIAYSLDHPGAAARILTNFIKKNNKIKIKGACFEGKFFKKQEINKLSSIPTYNESLSRLLLIIKTSSITKLMLTILAIKNIKK
ncbi:50S ribosomal protein L10 [Buchnera aphidicola (Taiwanaphis decaspermi)]|uniref:50S ribosomal protein L10 n=1 Tax=Buchnera aphidicola TaxID=9 RepID=UPI0031B83441